ncbi:MAG: peptidyl-tRNA hydrolase, partial [Gordonia sp. (in: high G+C Gram-positive bacteria)]
SMLGVRLMTEQEADDWYTAGCPLDVALPSKDRWATLSKAADRGEAIAVHDAGFTEIAPGSISVIATR